MALVLHVVGARPNFMKVAPLVAALDRRGVGCRLVHTGQHFDAKMSGVFFEELGLPRPDEDLGVGSGSHGEQTGRVMIAFERALLEGPRPDLVVVPGDVNSTVAAALVAAKLGIPVAHLEAGLRSFDRRMPEELNRIVADQLSDLCLTPSPDADANLLKEGLAPSRIVRVGNLMIDTLRAHLPRAREVNAAAALGLAPGGYAVATLHRPSNVDDPATLGPLLGALAELSRALPVVFPVHPRTRARIEAGGGTVPDGLRLVEPQGYLAFLGLVAGARLVLTDSGGLQEESTALGVPCLTLRENTERPITVDEGTNELVGTAPAAILAAARRVLDGGGKRGRVPALWDGRAGERAADAVLAFLGLAERGAAPVTGAGADARAS